MVEVSDGEVDIWRNIVDYALDDLDDGDVERAESRLRHLRDCL